MVKSLLNIKKNLQAQVDKDKSARFSAEFQNISGKIGLVNWLRNNLPELRRMKSVYWDATNNWWVVDAADSPPIFTEQLPLRIGGCPVFIVNLKNSIYRQGEFPDHFEDITPLSIAEDASLRKIATVFPGSIGMRVHKWGHVEILYPNQNELSAHLNGSFPGTIGGMTWGLSIIDIGTSSAGTAAGIQVASQPDEIFNVLGCIGLRIRRAQDAWDSWTTITHAWMTRPATDRLWLRNMKANLLVLLRRSKRLSKTVDRAVESTAEGRTSQSVLGTPIFLANTKTQVGTITTCYDTLPLPDSTTMFPLGLQHDLCLITGQNIPQMVMPPNMPQLDKHFADPKQALRAPEVFVTRFNVRYSRWDTFAGNLITGPPREALVSGMDYFWEKGHVKLKRAILWRTERDDTSVTGASGSALCLGNKSGKTCQAIVFQNYQSLIGKNKFWENCDVQNFLAGLPRLASFKGGFLLPEDVKNAQIVFEDDRPQWRNFTGPTIATQLPSEPSRSVSECL